MKKRLTWEQEEARIGKILGIGAVLVGLLTGITLILLSSLGNYPKETSSVINVAGRYTIIVTIIAIIVHLLRSARATSKKRGSPN